MKIRDGRPCSQHDLPSIISIVLQGSPKELYVGKVA
jgi:hypothetical protein